jgi:hypothetical protein
MDGGLHDNLWFTRAVEDHPDQSFDSPSHPGIHQGGQVPAKA